MASGRKAASAGASRRGRGATPVSALSPGSEGVTAILEMLSCSLAVGKHAFVFGGQVCAFLCSKPRDILDTI